MSSLPDRIDRWLRGDRQTLLVLGVFALVTAVWYSPPVAASRPRMPAVETYLPMLVWAIVWAATGVALITLAVRGDHRILAVTWAAVVPVLWAGIYLWAWVAGDSDSGYITATTFALVAYLIASRFSLVPVPMMKNRGS